MVAMKNMQENEKVRNENKGLSGKREKRLHIRKIFYKTKGKRWVVE